jgi:hypothetical protein
MPNVFKQLDSQIKLQAEAHPEGITILDLADLPSNMKQIMKLMLREQELTLSEVIAKNQSFPEQERLSEDQLTTALDELTGQFWLICRGEGDKRRYQVNLRYKKGIKAVWSILDERIQKKSNN